MATYIGTKEEKELQFQDDLATFIAVLGEFWTYWVDAEVTTPDGTSYKPNGSSYHVFSNTLAPAGSHSLNVLLRHTQGDWLPFNIYNINVKIHNTIKLLKADKLFIGDKDRDKKIAELEVIINERGTKKFACDPVELFHAGIGSSFRRSMNEMFTLMGLTTQELNSGIWLNAAPDYASRLTVNRVRRQLLQESQIDEDTQLSIYADEKGQSIISMIKDPYFKEVVTRLGANISLSRLYEHTIHDLAGLVNAGANTGGGSIVEIKNSLQEEYRPNQPIRASKIDIGVVNNFRLSLTSMLDYEGYVLDANGAIKIDISTTQKGRFGCPAGNPVKNINSRSFLANHGINPNAPMLSYLAAEEGIILRDLQRHVYDELEKIEQYPELIGDLLYVQPYVFDVMRGSAVEQIFQRETKE